MKIRTGIILMLFIAALWYLVESYTLVPAARTSSAEDQQIAPSIKTKEYADDGKNDVVFSVKVEQKGTLITVVSVGLNTHSVGLDDVDFGKNIWIEKDGKVSWPNAHVDEGGGHHRQSVLTFEYIPLPFSIVGKSIGGVDRRVLDIVQE